jgi:hypothetical protein
MVKGGTDHLEWASLNRLILNERSWISMGPSSLGLQGSGTASDQRIEADYHEPRVWETRVKTSTRNRGPTNGVAPLYMG